MAQPAYGSEGWGFESLRARSVLRRRTERPRDVGGVRHFATNLQVSALPRRSRPVILAILPTFSRGNTPTENDRDSQGQGT
jgi:hypothetical protein